MRESDRQEMRAGIASGVEGGKQDSEYLSHSLLLWEGMSAACEEVGGL